MIPRSTGILGSSSPMSRLFVLTYMLSLWIFVSCTNQRNDQFSRVEYYYRNEPKKSEAVAFLGQSARYHYGVPRHIVDSWGKKIMDIDCSNFISDSIYKSYLDSMGFHVKEDWAIRDIDAVSDDFLKENIELAFDSWQKPWSKDIPFNDFCKYILPYRNIDEELSAWRSILKQKYESSIMDSVEHPESLKDVVEYIIREVRHDIHYSTWFRKVYDNQLLTPEEMLKLGGLECRACAHYTTLALRACGVPCSMIELHWRFTEVPHYSVMVPAVGLNKKAFRINVGDTLIYMGEPKDSMAVWRAWAYNFSPNPHLMKLSEDNRIPIFFSHPVTREDITSKVSRTHDFSTIIPNSLDCNKSIFLCRFDNWEWYPIREGVLMDNRVYFHDATIHQWYRIGILDRGHVNTYGNTFTLLGNGQVQPMNNVGDSVIFSINYNYNPKDILLTQIDTIYYWGKENQWIEEVIRTRLWGYNKKYEREEPYNPKQHKSYNELYYKITTKQPRWTVLYNKHFGRPIGYYPKKNNEGKIDIMDY